MRMLLYMYTPNLSVFALFKALLKWALGCLCFLCMMNQLKTQESVRICANGLRKNIYGKGKKWTYLKNIHNWTCMPSGLVCDTRRGNCVGSWEGAAQ